jgi:hypothetical protein
MDIASLIVNLRQRGIAVWIEGDTLRLRAEKGAISEGYPGLPVRLSLLVVDESCNPVEGASVDIWHAGIAGLYSGSDAVDFCTSDDADAESHRYFRGVRTTGADGRVDFDTCYPGWYQGRAIHIHFTLRVGGQEYVTSQLFLPEDLTTQIFADHPDYKDFGPPDTSNSTDMLYSDEGALRPGALSARALGGAHPPAAAERVMVRRAAAAAARQ